MRLRTRAASATASPRAPCAVSVCGGSAGILRLVAAALPRAQVLRRQLTCAIARDVADKEDGGVLGPVEAVEELQAVVVLVGHVLDVLQEAHRRVLVGVAVKAVSYSTSSSFCVGVGAVLVVFAQHGQRFGLVRRLAVLQPLEAVGLHLEDLVEVFLREDGVVRRAILGGGGVGVRARALHERVALLGRVVLAAAEHQVLEQVRVAALAWLDLVSRTGLHDDVQRHHVRIVGWHRDETKAVRQVVDAVRVREKILCGGFPGSLPVA